MNYHVPLWEVLLCGVALIPWAYAFWTRGRTIKILMKTCETQQKALEDFAQSVRSIGGNR